MLNVLASLAIIEIIKYLIHMIDSVDASSVFSFEDCIICVVECRTHMFILTRLVCDCVLIPERRYISDSYSGNTSEPLIWSQSYFSVIDTQS